MEMLGNVDDFVAYDPADSPPLLRHAVSLIPPNFLVRDCIKTENFANEINTLTVAAEVDYDYARGTKIQLDNFIAQAESLLVKDVEKLEYANEYARPTAIFYMPDYLSRNQIFCLVRRGFELGRNLMLGLPNDDEL